MTREEIRKNNPLHKLIKLDKEDRHLLKEHSWTLNNTGYPYALIRPKHTLIHHLILSKKNGFVIDHINRNPLDNRRCNLRYATDSQNAINRKISVKNKSGYRGVYWKKESKIWVSAIVKNGKRIFLGSFSNKKKASKAFIKKSKELFGEFVGETKAKKIC
jgi:hypothetical protein